MSGATHLRGIAIAGALAALALAGAFLTFAMNQDASKAATPPAILPLKDRHTAAAKIAPKVTPATTVAAKAKVKPKVKPKPKPAPVDPNLKAALAAGLPRTIAEGLAQAPVAVVELSSQEDSVSIQATAEAKAGAALGGAAFVPVDVDKDSTTVQGLARLLEQVPDAPTALIYTRPATLSLTLSGYVDQTVVQQAVSNADPTLLTQSSTASETAGAWAAQANAVCGKLGAAGGNKLAVGLQAIPTPAGAAGAQVKKLDQLLTKDVALSKTVSSAHAKGDKQASAKALNEQATVQKQEAASEGELGATTCSGGA